MPVKMREVLNTNWAEMLPRMEAALSTAVFVAIDQEFSGLRDATKEDVSLFDDNESRYLKLKAQIAEFSIVQFGASMFSLDQETGDFVCDVFSVYLFPRHGVNLKFQAASVEFLSRYDFDFNKMMKNGLGYVSMAEQEALRKSVSDGSFVRQQAATISVDVADILKNTCTAVVSWAISHKEGEQLTVQCPPSVHIVCLLSALRHSCHNIVAWANGNEVIVKRVGREERPKAEATGFAQEESEAFEPLIGFSKFFNLMVEKKLPLVGHNLLLDLMMLFQQFIGPLPSSFGIFKSSLLKHFPVVFDTKFISAEVRWKNELNDAWDTDLQRLYSFLCSERCETLAPGASKIVSRCDDEEAGADSISGDDCQEQKQHFHDAGWDSYCSGFAFLRLAHINALINSELGKNQPKWSDLLDSVLPFQNKIHLAMGQTSHIVLDGPELGTNVPRVIVLQTRRGYSELKHEDLDTFVQFGSMDIKYLNKRQALLAVSSVECLKDILKFCKGHLKYKAEIYSRLKHVPLVSGALKVGASVLIGSGLVVLLRGIELQAS